MKAISFIGCQRANYLNHNTNSNKNVSNPSFQQNIQSEVGVYYTKVPLPVILAMQNGVALNESGKEYNQDYYENGIEKGVSCYTNYSWKPEVTLPICDKYIEFLDLKEGDKVLDYGCAKGFMVKGLRQRGIDAYGYDISKYAISKSPKDVKNYLTNDFSDFEQPFDWIILKDVLEHVEKKDLPKVLKRIRNNSDNSFIIIPLAKDGKYIVPDNEKDATHKIRESVDWWCDQFENAGFEIEDVRFSLPPIKEHQTSKYPDGTAFIKLKS